MSGDMTLVLRFKADGTAEVVSAAKQTEQAVTSVGKAGAEAGRVAKAATDEAALAQARLAKLIQETATPVEQLQARLAELATLAPFVSTAEQAKALERATTELDRAIASHTDEVRTAAAAQERLAGLVEKTRTPVERLQATLAELERLRPFATSAEEADALARATTAAEAALNSYTLAGQQAAAAQERLAALIDETRTPVERLQARLAELAALRPFATTEAEAEALTRAIASTEAALTSYDARAKETAAAQARLAGLIDQTRTPVERLQTTLVELERLRPFVQTADEAEALTRAIGAARGALAGHNTVAQQAAAAQERLAVLIGETRTPVERLRARLAELAALHPFATTSAEAEALARAIASTEATLATYDARATEAAAAQARLASVIDGTRTPVERLQARLAELAALRPFASSIAETQALARAIASTEAELEAHSDAAQQAAAAQGQLARLVGATATAGERLEAELRQLEALRPFVRTAQDAMALERSLSRVRAEMAQVNAVQNGMARSSGLAAHELTNLSFQAQDFIVQIGSGQGLFVPLLQQGPQAVMAVGGLSRALSLLMTPATAVTVGFGAMALAGALVLARTSSISAEVRQLDVRLRALNPNLNATGAGLRAIATGIADQVGVTRDAAMSGVSTLAINPRINSASLLKDLAALSQDIQAVLGGDVAEWAGKLGDAFAGGASGIRKLDEALNFLTPTEAQSIAQMQRHGDQAGVLRVAMEALARQFGGSVRQMRSDAGNAFAEMGRAWDGLLDKLATSDIAQAIARVGAQIVTGVSWWVAGMPEAVKRAKELADASAELDLKQQQLAAATANGQKGRGVDLLAQQLKEAQQRYYDLAAAATAAAQAQQKAVTPSPATPGANTPAAGTNDAGASAANQKWLNDERQAYDDLSDAMRGNAAARTLARAEMEANREADRRNLNDPQRTDLIELRRKQAMLDMSAAAGDLTTSLTQQAQGNVALAAAYGVSTAAAIKQRAVNDAIAASAGNAAISIEELARQNVLSAVAQAAADGGKMVADMRLQVEAQERVAAAARDGAAAQAEAELKANIAAQTAGLLAAAQAAEAEGAAALGQVLRALAADYEGLARRADEAGKKRQGEETLRTTRQALEMAQRELSLMGQAEPYRARALRSLEIQQQAQGMVKTATTEQIAEWVRLQEQIADTQALVEFQRQVEATAREIGRDVSEALYDRLMEPGKATKVVDVFRAIFKRIAIAALETNIVLPIVTQVVGSMPGLFGIQAPTAGAAGGLAGSLTGGQAGGSGLLQNASTLVGAGRTGWSLLNGGAGLTATQYAGSFATSSVGQALGLSQSAVGVIPEAAASDMMLTGTGNAFVGGAGTIGAAAPYAAIGGIGGGLIGTATNSKLIGAASGAALGAGSAGLAASIWGMGSVGGPWGIAAAAVISAVMAALGTQKKTVGPNGESILSASSQGFAVSRNLTDNGGDAAKTQQLGEAATTALNAIVSSVGGKLSPSSSGEFGSLRFMEATGAYTSRVGGIDQEFTDAETAMQDFLRRTVRLYTDTGELAGVNADVKTALTTSKATKAEDLAADLEHAASFRATFDALNASFDPTNNQIKTFTAAAQELGEAVKTNIIDWKDKSAELELASEAQLTEAARKGVVAMMGLGPAVQPLAGIAAVTEQARINFEQFRPALVALGYSAAEVADLSARYRRKMEDDYTASVRLLQRQGAAALSALVDPSAGVSMADRFRSTLSLDPTVSAVAALVTQFDGVESAARTGTLTFGRLQTALTQIDAALMAGSISGEQYTTLVTTLTAAWETATGVLSAQRQGRVAIEQAIDPSWRPNLDARLSETGMSGPAIEALRPSFQAVLDAATAGTATAGQMRGALAALDTQLTRGVLTADQHRAAVSVLTGAWSDSATAAQAAATTITNDLTQQRQARDTLADLTARGLTLMGATTDAALLRSDLSAAQERERGANDNLPLLGLIQAAERASTIANALRQELVGAIDKQVQAVNANTSSLQETAQRWGQLAGLATAASSSLTDSNTYLAPWERYVAARSQFDAALATWNSDAPDDKRFAAAEQLQTLGQSLKEAATGWFGGTSSADAERVNAVWTQIGTNAQREVDAAQAQIAVNERQLASLEAARTAADAMGNRTVGSIETLTAQTAAAFSTLTETVRAVGTGMGSAGTTTTVTPILSAEQKYLAANPDVAANAYYATHIAEHYALAGAREGRDRNGLILTRDQEYLARYSDVAAAVQRGDYASGEEHYNRYGKFEGRAFAQGGVMTPWGELSLTQRAGGGIATQPTLAVYGEGDRPEAFVPLPDGRTIPVTVSMPRPTAPALSTGNAAGMERLAALLSAGNDLSAAVLAELGRNTRTTAAAGAESVAEARKARALASRQAAVAERLRRTAA